MKEQRDQARKTAEASKQQDDLITWRQKAAVLKQEIIRAKKEAYHSFLSQINYRTDSKKAHRFVSSLNNKQTRSIKQPLKFKNKEYVEDHEIAECFTKHYTLAEPLSKENKKTQKNIRNQIKNMITNSTTDE